MIAQSHAFDDVPDYVHGLIRGLLGVSEKEFVVVVDDKLRDEYIYQWPAPDRPFHLLTLNTNMKEHLNHVIALSALKLTRIYEMPPQERVVPKAMLDGRLPPDYEAELFSNFGSRPLEELVRRSRELYYAMTSQLTNIPINLRCEHFVYDR